MTERNQIAVPGRLFEPEREQAPRRFRCPTSVKELQLERVSAGEARRWIAAWHSRLPDTQRGPWMFAFVASYRGDRYGAALWHNPSARTLPQDWLELRRLAIAPDAPHCSASWMLGKMAKWLREMGSAPRIISYQDVDVHRGTIYKAAGWHVGATSKPRERDRLGTRAGTTRSYRSDINGQAPATAGKVRWEREL